MTRILYIANVRLPTEKAHGLQITQMCEAFADAGADLSLWVANRVNTAEMQQIDDLYTHYGVQRNFRVRRLPTLDLLPLVPDRTDAPARLIFYLQLATFTLSALIGLMFTRADLIYTRDARIVRAANWLRRGRVVYEAHQLAVNKTGLNNQRAAVRGALAVVSITARLQSDLQDLAGADTPPDKFIVAHDGVRAGRFEQMPTQATARARLGWQPGAFIVGYVGRLHTMMQEKGVGTLVTALADVPDVWLALVGGPDDMAAGYRAQWERLGLPSERFLYMPHVPPDEVPLCLAALDVCAMPRPFTTHFAYHTSPLKLFEYMASGRAVVATDLPGWADVVRHEENALLVPPSDVAALTAALRRLRDDAVLRERLGAAGRSDALTHYTWGARAVTILDHARAQLAV